MLFIITFLIRTFFLKMTWAYLATLDVKLYNFKNIFRDYLMHTNMNPNTYITVWTKYHKQHKVALNALC